MNPHVNFLIQLFYTVVALVNVNMHLKYLFNTAFLAYFATLLASYVLNYILIYYNKQLFITNKKLRTMMKEQYTIMKNMPDGVLIYK